MQEKKKKIQILLIEDDPFDQDYFQRSLSKSRLETQLVAVDSVQQGLEYLSNHSCDVVFSDYQLPEKDGLEFLREVRKYNVWMPIIIVSSEDSESLALSSLKEGATDFISKSLLTPDGLAHVIPSAIRYSLLSKKRAEAQKEVELMELSIKSVLEKLPVFLFSLDKKGIVQLVEGKALNQLCVKPKIFIKKSVFDIAKDYPHFLEGINMTLSGKKIKNTLTIKDTIFHIECRPIFRENGAVDGVYGIAQDFTERIKIQNALIDSKRRAEQTSIIKERFLANMSHEIRTPMNAIIGFAELLSKEQLENRQMLHVKSIEQASSNLLVIINDILDFSKIAEGKMSITKIPFQIKEKLKILQRTFQPQIKSSGLKLHVSVDIQTPEYIVGDPVRISQILMNLMSNAIKFTKTGSVNVSIEVKELTSSQVLLGFHVQDTGIGIPVSMLKDIFKSFTQVNDDASREYGGTGLGLAIVKQLVELHGGSIAVTSKQNEGTLFSVEIPFEISKNTLLKTKKMLPSAQDIDLLKGKKVLLVEDNMMNQLLTRTHLESSKLNVDLAVNGEIALEMLKNNEYDLILMDIQMPILNGIEATKAIRKLPTRNHIPIVAMTAHALPEEKNKCIEAGMNGYLSKPYKMEDLNNTVFEHIIGTKEQNKIIVSAEQKPQHVIPTTKPKQLCDLNVLKEIAGDNKTLMSELIAIYFEVSSSVVYTLSLQHTQKDYVGLRATLHKFLNSVNTIGISELSKLINRILDEKDIKKMNLDALIPEMLRLIELSRSELKENYGY